MNREILFRGKRVDNCAWETGSLVIGRMWTSEEKVYIADKMTTYHTPVIPETIGQYTGLTDRNDVKIFEGDVVKCYSREDVENCVVIFENGEFRLVPTRVYKDYQDGCGYYAIRCFVKIVLGNIHDNPEMLGGESK